MSESGKQEIMNDDSSKAFLGVRFVLFGFDPIKKEQVRSKLLDGGGVDVSRYCPDCTHVIVDKIVYDDPMCVSARRDGKTVVTSLWVDHSSDVGVIVDPASVMYRPLKDLNGIPGAKSLLICLTGYLRQDREDIMTMVGLMGANFSKPLLAQKVTHLICYKFEGEKYELAKRVPRIKIVNHRWLEDCLKSWVLLPEADYNQSGHELEMMEAEAKDSEEEREEIPAQSYGERKVVTALHNSKSSHQSPLKEDILNLTTSNIDACPQNTKSPLQSYLMQDLSEDLNLSVPGVLSNQNSNGLSSSAGKGPKLSPVSGFGQTHNRHPEMIDSFASHTICAKQSPPEASKSGAKSYSRKSLRNSNSRSPPSVNPGECNDGQNLMSLDIEQNGLNSVGADARVITASSLGNEQSSILPEKGNIATPSSSSKMQKITHTQGTGGNKASGTELLDETSNHPSGDTLCGRDAKSALDHTNSSPVNNCKIATPESSRQQCSKDAVETGLTGTMGLRTSPSSHNSHCKAISLGCSKDGGNDVEVQENEVQGVKVSSPGSRMETDKFHELADLELPTGGKSKLQSRILGKRCLSKRTENSKQTSGKGNARNKKGSIYPNKTTVYSAGGEEMKNKESLRSEKIMVPAMDIADGSKETGKSKPLESEAEQTGLLFDETEAPDDNETEAPEDKGEGEFNMAVHIDKSNDIELPLSIDKLKDKEINARKTDKRISVSNSDTDYRPAEQHGAINIVVDQTDCMKNATTAKVTKDKKCSSSRSKKASPTAKNPTQLREGAERKRVISGKSKRGVGKQKRVKVAETNQVNNALEADKENLPSVSREQILNAEKQGVEKVTHEMPCKSNERVNKVTEEQCVSHDEQGAGEMTLSSCEQPCKSNLQMEAEARCFIVSGHRLQRKEFQQVIKRLKGRSCRDSHQWSYQATHFIVPDPIRRTEKFFAAAASGRWILKVDYLTACNEAGKFLPEEPYEWHKKGLTEDLAINLEAPRKWRLLRQRTGHGAFYGMRIVIYGELVMPPLDTLKRVVKAGDGTILATSPPYNRFLMSDIDFAIVGPGMPREDMWVQEFMRHKIPCVSADYLVEYVCKPGYCLQKHVQYNTHDWAKGSLEKLIKRCSIED